MKTIELLVAELPTYADLLGVRVHRTLNGYRGETEEFLIQAYHCLEGWVILIAADHGKSVVLEVQNLESLKEVRLK